MNGLILAKEGFTGGSNLKPFRLVEVDVWARKAEDNISANIILNFANVSGLLNKIDRSDNSTSSDRSFPQSLLAQNSISIRLDKKNLVGFLTFSDGIEVRH